MRNTVIMMVIVFCFVVFADTNIFGLSTESFHGDCITYSTASGRSSNSFGRTFSGDDFQIALNLNRIKFTDNELEDLNMNRGIYMGLEGYMKLDPNVYIGIEIGYANPQGSRTIYSPDSPYDLNLVSRDPLHASKLDAKFTYIPIEFNVKYLLDQIHQDFFIDFGAGVSLNYFKYEIKGMIYPQDQYIETKDSEVLLGGQIFMNANYNLGKASFIGLTSKYQFTEKYYFVDLDNWRLGLQAGVRF